MDDSSSDLSSFNDNHKNQPHQTCPPLASPAGDDGRATSDEAKIIDGRKWARIHEEKLRERVQELKRTPLAINILVGDDPSSVLYTKIKENKAQELGLNFKTLKFAAQTSFSEVCKTIIRLNTEVDGLMVQLPLPDEFLGDHLAGELIGLIDPEKDIDGLTGEGSFPPAAVGAVLSLLKDEGIEVAGKKVVMVGASDLVGKPMVQQLEKLEAKVLICDRETKYLEDQTRLAEILVTATGVPGLIKGDMVKEGVVVIDVGASSKGRSASGREIIVGDVDFASVYPKASKITPVPGGVGPMTVITLLENVVCIAAQK